MFILSAVLKIIIEKWKRFLLFLIFTAFLSVSAGFLGQLLLYNNTITDPLTIVLIDRDNSTQSKMFLQILYEIDSYKELIYFTQETDAESDAAATVIIPEGFASNVMNGRNEPFTVILNDNQPIKQVLVRYFTDAFADLLAASQAGVYAALDYASLNVEGGYDRIFMLINLKFLNIVLNRTDMLTTRTVSAVTGTSVLSYYLAAFWIFFNISGMILFIDLLANNFHSFMLKRMKSEGIGVLRLVCEMILAVFIVFLSINLFLLTPAFILFLPGINVHIILSISVILLCVSTSTVFLSGIFKRPQTAGVTITCVSLAGLFLSGGIIPRDFLSGLIKNISYLTFNYWAHTSVLAGLEGRTHNTSIIIMLLLFCILLGLSYAAFIRRRAGEAV